MLIVCIKPSHFIILNDHSMVSQNAFKALLSKFCEYYFIYFIDTTQIKVISSKIEWKLENPRD